MASTAESVEPTKFRLSTLGQQAAKQKDAPSYKLRQTYYCFETKEKPKPENTAEPFHFNDFDESQQRFLVECREHYLERMKEGSDARFDQESDVLSDDSRKESFMILDFGRKSTKMMKSIASGFSAFSTNLSSLRKEFVGSGEHQLDARNNSKMSGVFSYLNPEKKYNSVNTGTMRGTTMSKASDRYSARHSTQYQFTHAFTKEERRFLGRDEAILHPLSLIRILWELLTIVPTMYTLFCVPVEVAFQSGIQISDFTRGMIVADLWFLLDIFLSYHTGYYDRKKKIVIMNRTLVSRHYLYSFQIWMDIVSTIPLDVIYNIINFAIWRMCGTAIMSKSVGLSRGALKSLRLFKLLRSQRGLKYLNRSVERFSRQFTQADAFYKFFRIVLPILIFVHFSGLLQWAIPLYFNFPEDSWPVLNNLASPGTKSYHTFKSYDDTKSYHSTIFDDNHKAQAFIETQGPPKLSKTHYWEIYVFCLCRSMSQMLTLGYGGAPRCTSELIMVGCFMLGGAILWAVLLAHIITFTQSLAVNEDLYNLKMREIISYADFKNLPMVSKKLIFLFFERRWLGKVFDEEQILEDLSPCLRRKVLQHTRLPWIKNSPLFKNCSSQYLLELCYTMKDELYMPNQLVVSAGRLCEQLILSYQGDLLQYIPRLDIMEVLHPGIVLGETSVVNREFWNGEVYSLGWTRALVLNPADVRGIGRIFPKDLNIIMTNFEKYLKVVDNLTYITEINDRLEDVREEIRKEDQAAIMMAQKDAHDTHFQMNADMRTKFSEFIDTDAREHQASIMSSMFGNDDRTMGPMMSNTKVGRGIDRDQRANLKELFSRAETPCTIVEDGEDHAFGILEKKYSQPSKNSKEEVINVVNDQLMLGSQKQKRRQSAISFQLDLPEGQGGRKQSAVSLKLNDTELDDVEAGTPTDSNPQSRGNSVLFRESRQSMLSNNPRESRMSMMSKRSMLSMRYGTNEQFAQNFEDRKDTNLLGGATAGIQPTKSAIAGFQTWLTRTRNHSDQHNFNPTNEGRRGPALFAQSQMLQTMLIKRKSVAIESLASVGAITNDEIEAYGNPDEQLDWKSKQHMEMEESRKKEMKMTMKQNNRKNSMMMDAMAMGISPELLHSCHNDEVQQDRRKSRRESRISIGGQRMSALNMRQSIRRGSCIPPAGGEDGSPSAPLNRRASMAARRASLVPAVAALRRKHSLMPGGLNTQDENDTPDENTRPSLAPILSATPKPSVTNALRCDDAGNVLPVLPTFDFDTTRDISSNNVGPGGAPALQRKQSVSTGRQSLAIRASETRTGRSLTSKLKSAVKLSTLKKKSEILLGVRSPSKSRFSSTSLADHGADQQNSDDDDELRDRQSVLGGRESNIEVRNSTLDGRMSMLDMRASHARERDSVLGARESQVDARQSQISLLDNRASRMSVKERWSRADVRPSRAAGRRGSVVQEGLRSSLAAAVTAKQAASKLASSVTAGTALSGIAALRSTTNLNQQLSALAEPDREGRKLARRISSQMKAINRQSMARDAPENVDRYEPKEELDTIASETTDVAQSQPRGSNTSLFRRTSSVSNLGGGLGVRASAAQFNSYNNYTVHEDSEDEEQAELDHRVHESNHQSIVEDSQSESEPEDGTADGYRSSQAWTNVADIDFDASSGSSCTELEEIEELSVVDDARGL